MTANTLIKLLCKPNIYYALAIIPAIIYFGFLLNYATNTPFHDDYYDVLVPLILYEDSANLAGALKGLFWQYHQHYVFYDRIVYWILHTLTPSINFKTIIIIGNLSLIVLFLQLSSSTRRPQLFILPCASAVFFNLYFNESAFWPMAAVQTLTIMALSFASLQLLNTGKSILAACFFLWMAAFTQSNGILIIPLGFLLLLSDVHRKNLPLLNKNLLIWSVSSAMCLILFYTFENVSRMDHYTSELSTHRTTTPWRDITISFLSSLASLPFRESDNPLYGVIPGFLHFPIIIFFIVRSWKHNRALSLMLIFCTLSLLTASIMRTPNQGHTAYVSHYKILCTAILTIEILLVPLLIPAQKTITLLVCFFSILIAAYGYAMNSSDVKSYTPYRQQNVMEWFYSGDIMGFPLINAILDDAYRRGMYNPASDFGYPALPADTIEMDNCPAISAESGNKLPLHVSSAPYSRGALIWSDQDNIATATHQEILAVWLCGEKNYRIRLQQTVMIELWSGQKKYQLLILEKNRFVTGNYQLLAETTAGTHRINETIDNTFTPETPKDCDTYKQSIIDVFPLLYTRYCKSGSDT